MTDTTDKPVGPWWARYIPGLRDIVAIGYFGLAARLLYMIEGDRTLLKDEAFMIIVTLILGTGGLGMIAAFLFGGTKAGSDVMTAQSTSVIKAAAKPDATTQA